MEKIVENKSDWILAFLHISGTSGENEPVEGSVKLMKQLFLFKERTKKVIPNFLKFEFYDFKPYLYGPCSFEIYGDIEKLKEKGLILVTKQPSKRWEVYKLTTKGKKKAKEIIEKIPPPIGLIMEQIKVEFNLLSFISLLKHIYKKYPKWAKNSIINVY